MTGCVLPFCSYLNLFFTDFTLIFFTRALVVLMLALFLLLPQMPPSLLAKSFCSPYLDGVKIFTLEVSKTLCLN